MADQVIGIQFGVAGEGSISGESGKRIKEQLENIARQIKLQVNIDEDYFTKQLPQLKSDLEKQLGKLPINIRTNVSASSSSRGVTPSSNVGTSQSAHSAEYNAIVQSVEKAKIEAKKLFSILNQDTNFFGLKNSNYQSILAGIDKQVAGMIEKLNTEGIDVVNPQEILEVDKLTKSIHKVKEETMRITQAKQDDKLVNMQAGYEGLRAKVQQLNKTHIDLIKHNKDAAAEMQRLQNLANQPMSSNFNDANAQIRTLTEETRKASARFDELEVKTDTVGTKLRKTFTSKILQKFAYLLITLAARAMRQLFDNVVKIDKAMTSLRIVTKANEKDLKSFSNTVQQSAKKIGKSVTELIESTTVFARLGYSLQDAAKLAEKTTMYSNVSGVAVGDATTNITAIVKAFGVSADEVEGVLDKLIYVGNNFAISSGEIGEGMNNAASALAANGNTLEEAIGILTAANVTVQNASKSSTAVRTIAARMSASITELEELGEDANNVLSTAKLADEMQRYGISIVDATGNLRSTYDVLKDISAIWGRLESTDQSAIAGMLAGTRQQNAFYSIMQNWSDAEKVVGSASKSVGELQKANEAYLNSIEGKTAQLKASWESFSVSLLNSDLVKFLIDLVRGIADVLTAIIKLGDGAPVKIAIVVAAVVGLSIAVKALNNVIGGDLPGAIARLKASIISAGHSIKAAMVSLIKSPYFSIGLIVSILVLWGDKMHGIAQAIVAGVLLIGAIITTTLAMVNASIHAFMASNPLGWILAIITAIVSAATLAIKAIKKLINRRSEASKQAKEAAKEAKELAEKTAEESKSLDDLIKQYENVASSEYIDSDKREKIRDIQKEINKLVGEEAVGIDAVNGRLGDTLKAYKQMQLNYENDKHKTYLDSYNAARNSSSKAHIEYQEQSGWTRFWNGALGYDMSFEYNGAKNDKAFDLELLRRLTNIRGWDFDDTVYVSKNADVGNTNGSTIVINWDVSGASNRIEVLNNAIATIEDYASTTDYTYTTLYKKLKSIRDRYQEFIDSEDAAAGDLLQHVTNISGLTQELESDIIVNSIDSYNEFKQQLQQTVWQSDDLTQAVKDGFIKEGDVYDAVDDYMADNFRYWYDKTAEYIQKKGHVYRSYISILEEVEDQFDALDSVLSDIEEQGIAAGDSIKSLLEKNPDLIKYFTMTQDGYTLADAFQDSGAIIDAFVEEFLQPYVNALAECEEGTEAWITEQQNLNNAIAVFATLMRTRAIDTATKQFEDQKDALDSQLDKYKKLIDIRKKLLDTYADEVSYQRELAQKQKDVADLRTKLALAQMDNSAAGKANARKLEQQLISSQQELEDYTLERAISDITNSLSDQQSEYEDFISTRLKEIEDAINNIKTTVSVEVKVPTATTTTSSSSSGSTGGGLAYKDRWTSYADAVADGYANIAGASQSERGRVKGWDNPKTGQKYTSYQEYLDVMYEKYIGRAPRYHTGGFVGDASVLKSNEIFATLLRGEFVVTPKQIDSFMNRTLPAIASGAQSGASIEYNSPLIEINCDSINNDTLPKLKDIVDQAVGKIKKEMTSALSRTGFRKQY